MGSEQDEKTHINHIRILAASQHFQSKFLQQGRQGRFAVAHIKLSPAVNVDYIKWQQWSRYDQNYIQAHYYQGGNHMLQITIHKLTPQTMDAPQDPMPPGHGRSLSLVSCPMC